MSSPNKTLAAIDDEIESLRREVYEKDAIMKRAKREISNAETELAQKRIERAILSSLVAEDYANAGNVLAHNVPTNCNILPPWIIQLLNFQPKAESIYIAAQILLHLEKSVLIESQMYDCCPHHILNFAKLLSAHFQWPNPIAHHTPTIRTDCNNSDCKQ